MPNNTWTSGSNFDDQYTGPVITCYNASGNVSGTNDVGSVVGYNEGTVTACYWTYELTGDLQG